MSDDKPGMTNAAGISPDVPPALRRWFVAHCIVDVVFAIPLMVTPTLFLEAVGIQSQDTVLPRLVAAALFAIGLQSWVGRNEGRDAFRAMVNLKIIWASAAVAGMVWSLADGADAVVWAFIAPFAAFLGVWVYYRGKLN